ncbi:MAG: tetratricopeptide repeat protein [Candidatus Entotheonellia bacterium]
MSKALRRRSQLLWALIGSLVLVLSALTLGGCGDSAPPPAATKPSAQVSPAGQSPVRQAATIRFTDVTVAAGIVFQHEAGASGKKWYPETMGAGGGFFDYDGDGLVDILLVNGRRWPGERQNPEPTMQLYRNLGDGTFADVTTAAGLDRPLYGMGFAAADYDNDGDQDLVVTGYRQSLFFINNGDGTFREATQQVGLQEGTWDSAGVFFDYDRDGFLDLIIGHYVEWDPSKETHLDCTYGSPQKDYCAVHHFVGQGLTIYRNLGNGRFRDVTVQAGIEAPGARVLGITIVDYNHDSWPDVLVANDLTPSLFFANNGDGTFREIGAQTGLVMDEGGIAFAGMGIDAAYINNDAQLCVAIGNFTGQPTTLHCQMRTGNTYQPEVFVEQSLRAGIARPTLRMVTFGLFFFDADLDGWQDLFMVNGHVVNEERLRNVPYAQPPQLFRNRGNGTFEEVASAPGAGLDLRIIGRGAAYADYDNDGDLDLLLTANQGHAYLLRNETPRTGHFLRVITRGSRSNRDGIGAQLRLHTDRRQLSGMVRTGSTYLSQSELPLTFGLQAGEQIDRLEVLWPSGLRDIFQHIPPDTTFMAQEGTSPAQTIAARHSAMPSPSMGEGEGGGVVSAPIPPILAFPHGGGKESEKDYLALKRAAIAHYQAGRMADAIAAFEHVLQHQPDDYMAQQYLIELSWRRGAPGRARTLLAEMARTLADANFLMQFAFHLEEVRLPDLAAAVYREAARLDPQAPEAPYRLGKHALQARRYAEAVVQFREALTRQPHLLDAVHGLGLAYAAQGKTVEAEAQFQEALRLAPDFAEAYTHLGKIYASTGRLDDAIEVYRKVLMLEPNRAQGYHNLGAVLTAKGMVDAAAEQFREALQRDPYYLPAYNDLGTLYAEQGDMEQAIAVFSAAIQIDPRWVPAHYNLAMAYAARGEVAAMVGELEETLRLDPQHLDAHLNLGIAHLQQGKAAAAIERFRAVIGLDPNHAMAHSVLASLYFQDHQYELARRHAEKASQLGAPVERLLEALRQAPGQSR